MWKMNVQLSVNLALPVLAVCPGRIGALSSAFLTDTTPVYSGYEEYCIVHHFCLLEEVRSQLE